MITPEELPVWVPGDILSDSAPLRWKGIGQRSYRKCAEEAAAGYPSFAMA